MELMEPAKFTLYLATRQSTVASLDHSIMDHVSKCHLLMLAINKLMKHQAEFPPSILQEVRQEPDWQAAILKKMRNISEQMLKFYMQGLGMLQQGKDHSGLSPPPGFLLHPPPDHCTPPPAAPQHLSFYPQPYHPPPAGPNYSFPVSTVPSEFNYLPGPINMDGPFDCEKTDVLQDLDDMLKEYEGGGGDALKFTEDLSQAGAWQPNAWAQATVSTNYSSQLYFNHENNGMYYGQHPPVQHSQPVEMYNEASLTPPPPPPRINDPVSIRCVTCSLDLIEHNFETHVGNASQHKGRVIWYWLNFGILLWKIILFCFLFWPF